MQSSHKLLTVKYVCVFQRNVASKGQIKGHNTYSRGSKVKNKISDDKQGLVRMLAL